MVINTKQSNAHTNSTANHSFQTANRWGQNIHAFKSNYNQLPPHPFYYFLFMHWQEHGSHLTKKSWVFWKNLHYLKIKLFNNQNRERASWFLKTRKKEKKQRPKKPNQIKPNQIKFPLWCVLDTSFYPLIISSFTN